MKKLWSEIRTEWRGLILVTCAVACAHIAFYAMAAAKASPPPPPGDVVISIPLPAAKVAKIKATFLAKIPHEMIDDPAWVYDPNAPDEYAPQIQKRTDKGHIRFWMIKELRKVCRNGESILAEQNAVHDPNMIPE